MATPAITLNPNRITAQLVRQHDHILAAKSPEERQAAANAAMATHPNSYFRNLAAQKRVCPGCLSRPLWLEPSAAGNPNAATEHCACGYIRVVLAPECARIPWGKTASPEYPGGPNWQWDRRAPVPVEYQAIEPYVPEDEWRRMQQEASMPANVIQVDFGCTAAARID